MRELSVSLRTPLQLQLLGPVRLLRGGAHGSASLISQPRRLALLAYLALARPRGLHARDTLAALLWPESDQGRARHALRNALHGIRTAAGRGVIVTEGDALVGVDRRSLACDVIELEDALAAGRYDRLVAGELPPLMGGFFVSDAPAFEEWVGAERRRVAELGLGALLSLSESRERAGDTEGAATAARRACDAAPTDERALRRLIELLDRRGDAAAAIEAYRQFAARLEREFGVAPSPATGALADGVRSRAAAPASVAGRALPAAAPTTDGIGYVHYVRGTYLCLRAAHKGDADDLERSRLLFEEALSRDPGFAYAYAGLSNYYAIAAARNILRPFDAAFGRAIEMSRRALALDPAQAIPHVHFGVKAMYLDCAWEEAGREFATAVSLDPSYAEAQRFLGIWHDAMGRPVEALAALREAVRLEPQIAMFRNTLASALMDRGDWVGALEELRRARAMDPGYGAARERLIRCAEELGQYAVALEERSQAPTIGPVDELRRAFAQDGPAGYTRVARDELRGMLPALEARARVHPPEHPGDLFTPPALRAALIHARLGDHASARQWEEEACRARPGLRPWFRSRPELARAGE